MEDCCCGPMKGRVHCLIQGQPGSVDKKRFQCVSSLLYKKNWLLVKVVWSLEGDFLAEDGQQGWRQLPDVVKLAGAMVAGGKVAGSKVAGGRVAGTVDGWVAGTVDGRVAGGIG